MFHLMLLMWADTHVPSDFYDDYYPHPLEDTLTSDILIILRNKKFKKSVITAFEN